MKKLKVRNFSLIVMLIFALGVFPGCGDGDDDDDGGPLGPGNEGDLGISVGSGSQPQISWTGGSVAVLGVVKGGFDVEGAPPVWAIANPYADLEGDHPAGGEDTISSPVTYGTTPSGAIDVTSKFGWQYEDLQTGQRYGVMVMKAAWKQDAWEDTSNYGIVEFVR